MNLCFSLAAVIVLALSMGCSESGINSSTDTRQVVGTGRIVTEERAFDTFTSISVNTVANVNLTSGTQQSFSITADDNIVDVIDTFVAGDILTIETEPGVNFRTGTTPVIDITMTDLQVLTFTGVGVITGQNILITDNLTVSLTGVGDIVLEMDVNELVSELTGVGSLVFSGSADTHTAQLSSVAVLRAFDLETNATSVTMTGAGFAQVTANQTLNATLTGVGSLFYKGNPAITSTVTGAGSIVDLNPLHRK